MGHITSRKKHRTTGKDITQIVIPHLDPQLVRDLDAMAAEEDRSRASLCRNIIAAAIENRRASAPAAA